MEEQNNQTIVATQATITDPQKIAYQDAIHYLEGLILPFDENTITITTDEQGNKTATLDPDFALKYKAFTNRMNQMEEQISQFKEYAYKILDANNIIEPFGNDGVYLKMTRPYTRTNVKSTELKEVLPEVFKLFSKDINCKGNVAIKVKEDEGYNPWDFLK